MFSILIPSWNNLDYLKLCVNSLKKNSEFSHQIIVHVNEGTDGTINWIETLSDVSYSHSIKNIGVCYALNAAATMAESEYIVFFNDDMYALPGWDTILLSEIKKTDGKGFFFSATAIEPKTKNPCAIQADYGSDPSSFEEARLLKEFREINKDDWSGSTWPPNVIHKDVWNIVGGYSVEFSPGMYSDPDFSMKLWNIGIREFRGLGKSRVYHFGSKSVNRVKKNKGYYKFIQKYGITAGFFTQKLLKRGESVQDLNASPEILEHSIFSFKNRFKRLIAFFKIKY